MTLGKQVASATAPTTVSAFAPAGPMLPNLSSDIPTVANDRRDQSPKLYFEVLQLQSMR